MHLRILVNRQMLPSVHGTMKNIRDKFKKKINFVKPLYKKVRFNPTKRFSSRNPLMVIVKEKNKLDGDDFTIGKRVANDRIDDFNVFTVKYTYLNNHLSNELPGTCNNEDNSKRNSRYLKTTQVNNDKINEIKKEQSEDWTMQDLAVKSDEKNIKVESLADLEDKTIILHRVPDTWLRMYPAPQIPGEGIWSIIFRCCMCQLGLISFLIIWTLGWLMAIHLLEGPNEILVAAEFEKEQNQLIIDLATELRQITPVSPKWRQAIESRIQLERKLTVDAVGRGARLHPGHFWSVPGTFLFMIYVMTALGFGAPMPMTMWGRTYTIIYACVSVPMHIYLMVNASTCIVIRVEKYVLRASKRLRVPLIVSDGACVLATGEDPNCSRNSELLKTSKNNVRKKLICILNCLCIGRCVPMATFLYYLCGSIVFGVMRSKKAWEIIMFPLEFTTSGGLDHVAGHIRIIYGLYVEGAMILLACALATLRRHSGAAINKMTVKYRLFTSEDCKDCIKPLPSVQTLVKQ